MVLNVDVTISPLTNVSVQSSSDALVPFSFYRKSRVVTLEWETFSGVVGANGVSYLTAKQSFSNMPRTAKTYPIIINYAGTERVTKVVIDPLSNDKVRFYLVINTPASDVMMGDQVTVYGSAITWISSGCD